MSELRRRVGEAVGAVVVGQEDAVGRVLAALVCGGHVLIEGPPGVAKTLLARTLAASLRLDFRRAQFTPDMLPSDLTGTMVLHGGELSFRPGPIFTNILLADEVNRTPPKTQAALLEAMQEAQVTIDGRPHRLPDPFLVLATQNPIEYEGTYPLPEAQLDRFLIRVELGYPSSEQEQAMLMLGRQNGQPAALAGLEPVAGAAELTAARGEVEAVTVSQEVAGYVIALVRETRGLPGVTLGASPRAAVHLLQVAKATAWLAGRAFLTPDDVIAVAPAALSHRLVLTPEAELERYTAAQAVATVLERVAVPR